MLAGDVERDGGDGNNWIMSEVWIVFSQMSAMSLDREGPQIEAVYSDRLRAEERCSELKSLAKSHYMMYDIESHEVL